MGVTIAGKFDGNVDPDPEQGPQLRKLILTPASSIEVRRVRWLWKDRVALGTLALLAGREGLGKSTLAYAIAADVTRGTLEGEHHGHPRGVIICAAEDSWGHTIVPRLIAAGADLDRVFRAEIEAYGGYLQGLSLPRDYAAVEESAAMVDAGLLVLDPLMSVIDSRLDTHRDREVRQALEPLVKLADNASMSIIGLIHHNKSGSTDALQLVMGSKAFSAVARSVHTCIPDPDDDTQTRKLFATSKNNLGRLDLPVLGFTIASHAVQTNDDGVAWTGRINWTGEVEGSMHEIMTRTTDPERSATDEAAEWLHQYLASKGGEAAKVDIEKAGKAGGHSTTALRRARERLRLEHRTWGFPKRTNWALPGSTVESTNGGDDPSRVTPSDTTGDTTVEPPASRVTPPDTTAVVPVASDVDTTVTQLALTSGNTETASRVHARAGGDDTTDMTVSLSPLQEPSRASRASHVSAPPRATPLDAATPDPPTQLVANYWTQPAPICPDCGWPIDTTEHTRICEEQP